MKSEIKNVFVAIDGFTTTSKILLQRKLADIEEIINKDNGKLVKAPEIIVSKATNPCCNSICIMFSYIPGKNLGKTKINFILDDYFYIDDKKIISDFPVTVEGINNQSCKRILAVWTETFSY